MQQPGVAADLQSSLAESQPIEGTPGRSTVTARMPASARSIARAVADELRGPAAPAAAGPIYRSAMPALGGGSFLDEIVGAGLPLVARVGAGDVHPGAEAHVEHAARGAGHALPEVLRSRFEGSLGADLGDVRVHDDDAAATASAAVGARAYALGQDVFMGAGQYQPGTADGALLLAHEVAHTVQQRGGGAAPQYKLDVSSPGDAAEVEADHAAAAMVAGVPFAVGGSPAGAARAIHRWANADGANEVLTAIARADRAAVQQIILAIETSRSNNTPGVQLPDRSITVAVADLHDLERRARARFESLGGGGDHGGAAAPEADHSPAPAAAPAADHPPAHAAEPPGVGLQARERFRQDFDLMRSEGYTMAGGWIKVRSVRLRIEEYEEQNPVPTPPGGERFQVVPATATQRAGAPTSVGMQVETPRFRQDEWQPLMGDVSGRTNFALTAAIAREGGVMTGNIGLGTVQVRQQHIPWVNEMSFECPIRIFEVARTRSGGSEIRLMEARPTFHAGPVRFGGGPSLRVSLEFAIGPNRTKVLAELARLGLRSAVTEAAAAETTAAETTAAETTAAETTAAETTAAETTATTAETTAATAETTAATAETTAATTAAETTAATAETTAAAAETTAATTTAAETTAATTTAAEGAVGSTALGGVLIAGGFILGGVATIAATFASLAESDAYFRTAEESQQRFYGLCASYSRVMRGLPPIGPAAEQQAGQRAAQATLARIAAQQHVTIAHVQSLAAQLGGAHFYNQAYDQGQARVRAAMVAATQRVTGVGDADGDNRVDALTVGGDLYRRYTTRWPL